MVQIDPLDTTIDATWQFADSNPTVHANMGLGVVASSHTMDDDPFKVPCRRKKVPRLDSCGRVRQRSESRIRRPVLRRSTRPRDANIQNVPASLETALAVIPHRPWPATGTCPTAYPGQRDQRQGFGRRGQPAPPRTGVRELGMEPLSDDEPNRKVIGEIAFQLDRRILSYVFNSRIQMYGFRVLNIPDKINEICTSAEEKNEMNDRYREIMLQLRNLGYHLQKHPSFTETIVNTFGIVKEKPQCPITLANYNNPDYLKKIIHENAPLNFVLDLMVLLSCLSHMSASDGKPLFVW